MNFHPDSKYLAGATERLREAMGPYFGFNCTNALRAFRRRSQRRCPFFKPPAGRRTLLPTTSRAQVFPFCFFGTRCAWFPERCFSEAQAQQTLSASLENLHLIPVQWRSEAEIGSWACHGSEGFSGQKRLNNCASAGVSATTNIWNGMKQSTYVSTIDQHAMTRETLSLMGD